MRFQSSSTNDFYLNMLCISQLHIGYKLSCCEMWTKTAFFYSDINKTTKRGDVVYNSGKIIPVRTFYSRYAWIKFETLPIFLDLILAFTNFNISYSQKIPMVSLV
jgi:hypothetical protein